MMFWGVFTRLADTNFMMPVAAILAIWLACARAWKQAAWWCLLFGAGLFIVVATKVAYVGWDIGIAAVDFTGVSGHAMRATAIAPVFAYILLQRQTPHRQRAGLLLGMGFGVAIGISRLLLHVHSLSEVLSGWLVGAAVSLGFIALCRRYAAFSFDRRLIVIALIPLLSTLTLQPAPTGHWIENVAIYLGASAHAAAQRPH